MSLVCRRACWPAGFLLLLTATAGAQYTTHVEKAPEKPTLRSVAVLEWTGELAKPTSSRLIPIAVWDGERYQPGGLYLAQPAPLALLSGTQYELEKAGEPTGFFNVRGAATLGDGGWVGVGKYQPVPSPPPPPKLKVSKQLPAPTPTTASKQASQKDAGTSDAGDRPTLHRKTDDSAASTTTTDTSKSTTTDASKSTTPAPVDDPDKPTLHRRADSDSGSSSSTTATDPDKPTLHKKSDDEASASTSSSDDPDRPTLHRRAGESPENAPDVDPDRPTLHKAPPAEATGADVGSAPGAVTASLAADPDRPMLRRGKPEQLDTALTPTKLESSGQPIRQMVAVSDVKPGEPHPYAYHWNSPEDEAKMRAAMEALAAQALAGRSPGSFGPATKVPKSKATAPALTDEHFDSYELAYSSGPTLVLSAQGGAAGDRYVTLIAQPDFYNQPRVLLRQVSTAATLDQTPRMQLVDAVDTDGDHQAELIFELIGAPATVAASHGPDRQYAIYRVTAAGATQVFTTGPLP
jgi:hypothetical protein